ncbi:MAG: hypothetical protein M3014_07725 [Chloroflexota bacterium]|nr:hypothetical protein [Chloroflexota bacterium]
MFSKKLLPVVALMLLVAGFVAAGASQPQGVKVPQGAVVDATSANALPAGKPRVIPDAPGLPAATQNILFSEDFSSSKLDNFTNLSGYEGTWLAMYGRLIQHGTANGDTTEDPAVLLARGVTLDNGSIEAQLFPLALPVGLVFRGSDAGFYRLDLYPNVANKGAKAVVRNVSHTGASKVVASAPVATYAGFTQNQWQLVRATLQGSKLEIAVNGKTIISATDQAYASGWAGVWSSADMGAQFDNIRIQQAAGR